jgi:sigma-B regulation protein RsbU (phosphoserine phosphatase)
MKMLNKISKERKNVSMFKIMNHMKRILLIFLFLICITATLEAAFYWDFPKVIAGTSANEVKSEVKAVDADGKILVFYLVERGKNASIEILPTEDLVNFGNPIVAKKGIELKKGFSPNFDVIYVNDTLYLMWNSIDGIIMVSTSNDRGLTWLEPEILVEHDNFCFDPRLFYENGTLYLFYHIESEGTRIDYFYVESKDFAETWSVPSQIARGFSGSFFPFLKMHRDKLYVVWQSRPLVETQLPIFNVYLAISGDSGLTWSQPILMTDSEFGDSTLPIITFERDSLYLIYEGERNGITGIYYREYDLDGDPLSEEIKINGQISNARAPDRLILDDELIVFYLDSRDGTERLYYSIRKEGEFEEFGPLGMKGKDIFRYFPHAEDDSIYLLVQQRDSIALIGPDNSVPDIKVITPKNSYIGTRGIVMKWQGLEDSSGLEGFIYSFNKEESDEPELINLSSFTKSVNLTAGEEGSYYFHLRTKDLAGNYSDTITIPFTIDLTPPPVPVITPLELDEEGYYADNSPAFNWTVEAPDIAGFNFALSARQKPLEDPRLRTGRNKAVYREVKGGDYYFKVAAVDRAGNIGETAMVAIKVKPLPQPPKIKLAPPWILSREAFKISPILNISLYLVLGGLLFVTFYIATDVIFKLMSKGEGVQMDGKPEETGIRKKRFGLRFKFSIMIVALILLVTVGISSVLSYVSIGTQRRALANQMMDKAMLSVENMTNVAREGILNNDELLLLSLIAKTMENEDIKYSIILDIENRVIAHSDINQRGNVFSDKVTIAASESDEIIVSPTFVSDELAEVYVLASPVVFAEQRVGTVQLGYTTDSIFKTINEARRTNIYSALYVSAVMIIVGIIGAFIMATITIKPIKILAHGAKVIGEGKLDYKIHIKTRDEIGLLSDEFNRMTGRLLEYQQKMQEKAKLDEQMEIAQKIQQDLIPQDGIDNDEISLDGFYKAAAGVGGDYYDFIKIGGGSYGVIMSDVAGKGVPASLMMIMIRTVFKSLIQSGLTEPAKVVTLMNETLASDISSDRFATTLFGVFNQKNNLFRYTNAGYGPILVYKNDKKKCFLVNPPKGSVPIGVMPGVDYTEEKPINLLEGDSLFLFTDGIHEARNEKEEEYGMKRLSDIIPGIASRESKEMANFIVDDVLKFAGTAEQYDDMTLTVMKIK